MSNKSRKKGEPMRMMRKGLSALVLAICLLLSNALGVTALAEDWASGPKTVTVTAATYKEDIESIAGDGAVVIEAYRIATIKNESGKYTFVAESPFASLQSALDSGNWKALANGAADLVKKNGDSGLETRSGKLNEVIDLSGSDDGDGVWLLMPHGGNKGKSSLAASSKQYDYTFSPIIVTVPTKDGVDDQGNLNTAYGEWVADAEVDLKVERTKTVTPPPRKRVPKTGEETTLMPFYVAMGVSGTLLALLAVQGIRRRRSEGIE